MDLLTWDAKLSQMCRHPAVIGDLTDVAGEAQDVQAHVWRELETKIAPAHDSVPSSAAAMGYLDIDPTGPEEAIDKLQRLQFAIVPMLDLLTAMTNGYYRAASALNNSLLELVVPTTDKIVGGRPFGSSLSHDRIYISNPLRKPGPRRLQRANNTFDKHQITQQMTRSNGKFY
jgi:hypothetical protein